MEHAAELALAALAATSGAGCPLVVGFVTAGVPRAVHVLPACTPLLAYMRICSDASALGDRLVACIRGTARGPCPMLLADTKPSNLLVHVGFGDGSASPTLLVWSADYDPCHVLPCCTCSPMLLDVLHCCLLACHLWAVSSSPCLDSHLATTARRSFTLLRIEAIRCHTALKSRWDPPGDEDACASDAATRAMMCARFHEAGVSVADDDTDGGFAAGLANKMTTKMQIIVHAYFVAHTGYACAQLRATFSRALAQGERVVDALVAAVVELA